VKAREKNKSSSQLDMILTLTPNTSIDRTVVLPHFRWGETIRSRESAVGMGGKRADGSWIMASADCHRNVVKKCLDQVQI
jgi:fructose-1-phosphate kinase PfkB-like protein